MNLPPQVKTPRHDRGRRSAARIVKNTIEEQKNQSVRGLRVVRHGGGTGLSALLRGERNTVLG